MTSHKYTVIPNPVPEIMRSESGMIEAVYIRVRTGKAVRAVRPDKKHLVYFFLGEDQLPVGIKLLEPVQGVAFSILYDMMTLDQDGCPSSMEQRAEHVFISDQAFRGFLKGFRLAEKQAANSMEMEAAR